MAILEHYAGAVSQTDDNLGLGTGSSTIYLTPISAAIPAFSTIEFISISFTHNTDQNAGSDSNMTKTVKYRPNGTGGVEINNGAIITDTTAFGNGTIHAGNSIDLSFYTKVTSGWYYVKGHSASATFGYTYTPYEYSIKFGMKNSISGEITMFQPTVNNKTFSGSLNGDGTATITVDDSYVTGFKFKCWDDEQSNTSKTRTIPVNADNTFLAIFEPISYTVNYYNSTSGSDVLIESQSCKYSIASSYPVLPSIANKTGYFINIGWVATKSGYNVYNTTNLKDSSNNEIVQYSGSFKNLTATEGAIVKYYINYFPKQYQVIYTSYTGGTTANYTTSTSYRIYNSSYSLETLPTPTTGYKLTNKMTSENSAVSSSITNAWFTSSTALSPTDEKITSVNATLAADTRVYSFETPITYFVKFNTILNGETLSTTTLTCTYNKNYSYELLPEEKEGYVAKGWYMGTQTITNWYIDRDNAIQGGTPAGTSYSPSSSFSNLTTSDQGIINRYAYYIPKAYYITYQWLDEFDPTEVALPEETVRIYGKEDAQVELIPIDSRYRIDNSETTHWYYFENDERLINFNDIISSTDTTNYIFYAIRHLPLYTITFTSNDLDFGDITFISGYKEGNEYEVGDTITVLVNPTSIAYFSNWSDGNNQPYRSFTVGQENINYEAIFRSNQIMGVKSLMLNNTEIKAVYKGSKAIYKE